MLTHTIPSHLKLTLVFTLLAHFYASAATLPTGHQILEETGVRGGFIVHLGCGDGKLTAQLRVNDSYQVHGLDRDGTNVAQARARIKTLGLYGEVSVDRLSGSHLPYIDNLVNLVVLEEQSAIDDAEIMRVLVPNGMAYVKRGGIWTKTVKPRPADIDEWTHFAYDATGNAVSHDDVVGPPRHLQWLGSPRWSRHHDRMASMSALVSAGGRIFYIMDEGSRISIQMPPDWRLTARDAFNGTVLWKQAVKTWHSHLWPLKSGPTQLARRLVATRDRVYVTLGIDAPLTALDASTGEILRSYEGSGGTEEIIHVDGKLFVVVNKGESQLRSFAPKHNVGDQARVRQEFLWKQTPRVLMALDADSGRVLWQKQSIVSPLTLSGDRLRTFYHDGEKVVCIDSASGDEQWCSEPASRRANVTTNFGPKLVVYGDVVLYAGGDRKMRALSVTDGKQLWEAPHERSGYQSPEDVLVAGGIVWNAPTTSSQDTGVFTGRDPMTGEVKHQFAPNVQTYWFHHRCYMAKATDKYLLPSRTGIEFVDPKQQDWNINHWVRGGCLYGVMPSNGLTYAPPHNCACYPEAKLYGLNALAPARKMKDEVGRMKAVANRLEKGPAYAAIKNQKSKIKSESDWPTYRHDAARSGSTSAKVATALTNAWETKIGGRLSAPTIAEGRLFVAQVDTHTLHALDAKSGEKLWSYTTGGRIDSPPTYTSGSLLFGSADGHVYSLRASDGVLRWRFRAAPTDLRLMSLEQLESVWPVHGTVLVQDAVASFVAGRSNYLDGGLRFCRLNANDGTLLSETIIDENDPETGENLQAKLQVLNMPVGLPDVLSSDGQNIFMRSQRFDLQGNRLAVGVHSGVPAEQGAVQRGEGAHLFAPMGFIDDTWFHRSYWVYGRSFAGGHGGYYQAGKYTPSGRILVFDEDNVYGFGRKAQYYKWTTTMEHQLFSSSKRPPKEAISASDSTARGAAKRRNNSGLIRFEKSPSLDPTDKPIVVSAWVNCESPNGVVLARGGPSLGYALLVKSGKPQWVVRTSADQTTVATANGRIVGTWTHLVGVLTAERKMELYINGNLAASAVAPSLIGGDPAQSLEIGGDEGGPVGDYRSPNLLMGTVDEVRVYYGTLTKDQIKSLNNPEARPAPGKLVLACSFDKGDAQDESGHDNHGKLEGVRRTTGQSGQAMRFRGSVGSAGSFVRHNWTTDVPLLVRAMVKADDKLVIVGPPDLIDEEETFNLLVNRDQAVHAMLAKQNEALKGEQGAILRIVSAESGNTIAERKLAALPVWDGMAAANGGLFLSTTDGSVVALR